MAFRSEDYPEDGTRPWLDRPDALEAIERRRKAGEITAEQAGWLEKWARDGYLTFEQVLPHALADEINVDVDQVLAENRHLPHGELIKKFENVYRRSAATRRAMVLPRVLAILDLLLGTRALPYQTLNLPASSQQAAHSDAILMTTHPHGYMLAVWFALEDIAPDSGPLKVYPGSHRLPYVGAHAVGIPRGVDETECGQVYDRNYYPLIARQVDERRLEPFTFLPKKGDCLLWHYNLLHGAHFKQRGEATRKSLIAHYYGAGATCYSDLFQRAIDLPALRPAGP